MNKLSQLTGASGDIQPNIKKSEVESTTFAPSVTVVIPTKNRKESLQRTIRSVLEQKITPQLIVIDDASTDQTGEMMKREFPGVIYERQQSSIGPSACRNRGAELGSGEFLVTLDDDCLFCKKDSLLEALQWFNLPEIGAITLPFVNINCDQVLRTAAPDKTDRFATLNFYGGMVAFRRDLFLKLGGYRAAYFMEGEEYDLATRLLQAGFIVQAGTSHIIDHDESPIRDYRKRRQLVSRNAVLYVFYNVPFVLHNTSSYNYYYKKYSIRYQIQVDCANTYRNL
jgi:glycosyltransferase involved in cell wall biosynthesis